MKLESYAVALRTGPRPRHVAHVHRNGGRRALCGVGPVLFVGDVLGIIDESVLDWPLCAKCAAIAGPDIVEGWNDAAS